MKFRNGFVSNSSSTSFIVYGYNIAMDDKDSLKILKDVFDIVIDDEVEDVGEFVFEKLERMLIKNLKTYELIYDYGSDEFFIGCGLRTENIASIEKNTMDELIKNFETSVYYKKEFEPKIHFGYTDSTF